MVEGMPVSVSFPKGRIIAPHFKVDPQLQLIRCAKQTQGKTGIWVFLACASVLGPGITARQKVFLFLLQYSETYKCKFHWPPAAGNQLLHPLGGSHNAGVPYMCRSFFQGDTSDLEYGVWRL